jgi:UDPglucose--hexose-1-phosphate uridylyltransferase
LAELRIDPLSGQRAIVAGDRAGRPGGELTATAAPPIDRDSDPFAEGHEDRTPPELYAVRPNGGGPNTPGWTVRVVPNLYPALSGTPDVPPVHANRDLDPEQVLGAMDVWRERMRAHDHAAYVHVIVNERREAGASLPHTHAQLYALDFVPSAIARERERSGAYATQTMGGNLLADLVQAEVRQRERIVAIDDEAVLMAPYGARLPYQLLLAPRVPRALFQDDGPTGASLLHDALGRLARRLGASPPLNLWVRTAPRGAEHFCWRIDIVPRLTHLAGLELGAGVHLNIVPPERVAAELREA